MAARSLDAKSHIGRRRGPAEAQALRQGSSCDTDRAVVALSRKLLADHYERRDLDAVMGVLADDFTWIGPLENMHASSAEEMRAIIEREYGTRVQIVDEDWAVHRLGGVLIAIGRYGAAIEGTEVEGIVFRQSATLVWRPTPAGPRVAHLHLSNSYDIPPRTDQPFSPGEDGLAYTIDAFSLPSSAPRRRLCLELPKGERRFIPEDRILRIEAEGRGALVVHEDGLVHAPERLGRLEERLPESFVRTHRSCLVNASRAVAVRRFSVSMDDGSSCPVSQRRYLDVAGALESAANRPLRNP